jgi:hypothetical protein
MRTPTTIEGLLEFDRQAREALRIFRRNVPHYQGVARALTQEPVKIIPSEMSATDGKNIYVRVPFELGDPKLQFHPDKQACKERDETSTLRCKACSTMERIHVELMHEIAHISMGSFEMADGYARDLLLDLVDDLAEKGEISDRIKARVDRESAAGGDYWKLCAAISKYLQLLINACEDVRVNNAMMDARRGTKKMFHAMLATGLEDRENGMKWIDTPPNFQMLAGIILTAHEFPLPELAPEVLEALEDSELKSLISDVANTDNVHETFGVSLPILRVLHRLGFFQMPNEEELDQMDQAEKDAEKSEGEGGSGGSGGVCEDDSGDDSDSDGTGSADDSDDESDDDPMGSPSEVADLYRKFAGHEQVSVDGKSDRSESEMEDGPDEAGDATLKPSGKFSDEEQQRELMKRVIKQVDHFDAPSVNVHGVGVHKYSDRARAWNKRDRYYDDTLSDIDVPEGLLAPALNRLRVVFTDNNSRRHERSLKRGRLDTRSLGKRVPIEDDRIFHKRQFPQDRDHSVLIGLDVSGSTAGDGGGICRLIKKAAYAKAEMLHRLGIRFAVYAHSGGPENADTYSYECTQVDLFEVKAFDDPWGPIQHGALRDLGPYSANLDGHTLEFYRKRMQAEDTTDKWIFYYTDGQMPAENYDEELEVLKFNIEMCRKLGIHLVGVGVRNDDPKEYGLDTIRLDRIEDLQVVVDGLRDRLELW